MNKKGFTLIELIIVVIIIGILASIAAPIMLQGMKARAICSEAVMTLATIRIALLTYYSRYHVLPDNLSGLCVNWPDKMNAIGIPLGDLQGTYFGKECYYVYGTNISNGVVAAYGRPDLPPFNSLENSAANHEEIDRFLGGNFKGVNQNGYLRMRLKDGYVTQYGISGSGYPAS